MKTVAARYQDCPPHELSPLARGILAQIKRRGYAELSDVFTEEALAGVEEFARQQCALRGQTTFDLKQDKLRSSVVEGISKNPFVLGLMKAVMHEAGVPYDLRDYHCRMRIKLGPDSSAFDNAFHFDGSYLTGVMPVLVPRTTGRLLLATRMRPYLRRERYDTLSRRFYASGPVQKFFRAGNPFIKKVPYTRGAMLFFKGFTTLHAGEPAGADSERIIVLFHIGNR